MNAPSCAPTGSVPSLIASRFAPLSTSGLLDGLDPAFNYAWAGLAFLLFCIIYSATRPKNLYDSIPAIGRTGLFSSYLDAMQFAQNGQDLLMKGYAKYQHGIFRVADKRRWQIIVSGPQFIDELRHAPDDVFSLSGATEETFAISLTIGPTLNTDPYHVPILKNQLTRNLGNLFPDLQEEIKLAFRDIIPPTENWTKVKAFEAGVTVVARASNRIFVGAPLCRDPEFLLLSITFASNVVNSGRTISLFPDLLKPIVARLLTTTPKAVRMVLKHTKPIIEERKRKIEKYGWDYPDKPVDMISWLLDEAQGKERTPENLTRRLLALNFVAIHTNSISFTGALFNLASRPEYIQPIREEVEAVVAEEGWTKVAMSRMRKLDSFLKESQRTKGLGALTMGRIALQEFTFSDGTRVPKGAMVSAVATPRHLDEEVYSDANTFKGFRFSDMRKEEGEAAKNQMVATSLDFLPFGHGRHACPGRFFAVNELKAMLAHIVLTYDLKMTDTPRYMHIGPNVTPDPKVEVLFRKRQA
ncbi:cytochrome P450 [Gautieria morchelliformis]|nr:cytochrome P450 [Gautieria morchelliformis]